MRAFQKYFNYKMTLSGCGSPYLILEGTAEDYQKINDKANKLRKYDIKEGKINWCLFFLKYN